MVLQKCKKGLVWDKTEKKCRPPKKRGPKKLSAGDNDDQSDVNNEDQEFFNAAASQQLGLTIGKHNKPSNK